MAPTHKRKSKHLAVMHIQHGVIPNSICGTCHYLQEGHCLRYNKHYTQWNRIWTACGLWEEQDDGLDGFEWVNTEDGWKLKRVRSTNGQVAQ